MRSRKLPWDVGVSLGAWSRFSVFQYPQLHVSTEGYSIHIHKKGRQSESWYILIRMYPARGEVEQERCPLVLGYDVSNFNVRIIKLKQ